ncbi:MAG: lipopolysaccharide assembly protein LapB [Comamonadaceae bacterium]|nr:MAG: lipopolysaccharide assembly protein LapB [Comamonadaceae bacterium]
MDFEPWWLIFLPLLFGLGWLAARVDIRQMLSETRMLPDSYFRGLNFLLNEEPDRAIDAFVEVAKLDPETTELHFALGSLFRRRGEMERAIRVHQSLLSRADLPQAQREHAQHELAQDFLKAGMLDRAESGFEQMKDSRFALPALQSLIRIYESEHDWARAIDSVKTLRGLVDEPVPQLVHYHCEQAHLALANTPPDIDAAHQALDAAEHAASDSDREGATRASSVRIAMLRARIAAQEGHPKQERLHLASVLSMAPDYVGLVAESLLQNYVDAGEDAQGLALLTAHYDKYPSLDLFNVVFRALRTQQGPTVAWTFARQALQHHPSLLGLDRLLEAELAAKDGVSDQGPVVGTDMNLLRSLIHKHTQRLDRYACRKCGFQARRFYWQCPGCNAWETYAPKRLEELQ